jgi:hypothetical protein
MSKDKVFIDPGKIKQDDLPLIVFSEDSSGLIGAIIRVRTRGSWNHSMQMIETKRFASQGNMFSTAPIDRYMKKGNRLEFWRIRGLTDNDKRIYKIKVQVDLAAPWHARMYDYLGILGQATGIRFINSFFRMYCSERVANDIKTIPFEKAGLYDWLTSNVPVRPTPGELNDFFMAHPDVFEFFGYWYA